MFNLLFCYDLLHQVRDPAERVATFLEEDLLILRGEVCAKLPDDPVVHSVAAEVLQRLKNRAAHLVLRGEPLRIRFLEGDGLLPDLHVHARGVRDVHYLSWNLSREPQESLFRADMVRFPDFGCANCERSAQFVTDSALDVVRKNG